MLLYCKYYEKSGMSLKKKNPVFLSFLLYRTSIYLKFLIRIGVDFIEIFQPLPKKTAVSPKAKQILIFNWRDLKHRYSGGAEVYLHEIAKQWVKMGSKVTLFCGNDGKCKRYEIIDGIEIIRRGGFYFVYIWAFLYYMLRFRGNYNVILDCENGIPFFTPLYAKEKIFCLVFHVHQEIFRRSLIKPLAAAVSFLEKKIMPSVYKKTQFITISKSSKKDMEELGITKGKISIISPGVDCKAYVPGKKSPRPLILYLGRLKFYKSVHLFLQTAKKLSEKFPNAEFIIAGDGEEMPNLKKLRKKLHLQKKVKILGRVSEKRKIELLQKAWVFINPSFMEGWAITTIEANACATPVVVSNVQGLKDSVESGRSGFLVKYGKVDDFVKYTSLLIKKESQRIRMSRFARIWAKNFSWNKSAKKHLEILK